MFGQDSVGWSEEVACRAGALHAVRDALLEVLSPTRCIGCERPGELLCAECAARIARVDPELACPRCGAPYGRLVCTECKGATALDWCVAAATFDSPVPEIVRGYKDAGERRLAGAVASIMAQAYLAALPYAPEGLAGVPRLLTFVPATARAYRRRGFDHMGAVAACLSPLLGAPVADVLAKLGKSDQRRLDREGRAASSRGAYRVVAPVSGLDLLLVDDVITTGATMSAAAGALKEAGARTVVGLALARVW